MNGIENGVISEKDEFDFGDADCGRFNYYGISYKSDAYMKGVITYTLKGEQYSEEFFLEPSDGTKPFYSFIDGVLEKIKSNTFCKITLEPLDKDAADMSQSYMEATYSIFFGSMQAIPISRQRKTGRLNHIGFQIKITAASCVKQPFSYMCFSINALTFASYLSFAS